MGAPGELGTRIELAASSIEGVERRAEVGGFRYALAGVDFALVSGARCAFRLRPELAEAALGTPDVRPSAVGEGWVELAPAEFDRFALDRATSWFAAAARYAAETGPGRRLH
ncbi:MAG: hypothetical protein ACP5VP_04010 [Candidatus Limnocylindrales bacterium]